MAQPIEGQRIVNVRQMTDAELEHNFPFGAGAHGNPPALELEDGTVLFPSQDPEGNGPGEIFGSQDDRDFILDP